MQIAPVSGEIVEINEKLNGEPGLVNRSPNDQGNQIKFENNDLSELRQLGWLCKVRLSDIKEVGSCVLIHVPQLTGSCKLDELLTLEAYAENYEP